MSLFNINRLILRSGTSPYGDTIRNAVLKWEDVDGNFLTLKGGLIEDITLSGNNLTFTTVDNQIIDIDLTGATCSGIYTDDIYNCSGDLTVWSDLTVNGNVVINGSATTINTEIIQAEDNNIVLNYSGTTASANGGGMTVLEAQGAGTPSTITVDENGCWHVDPGFCDLTIDGVAFTAQTPYIFTTDTGSTNSITTRYSGNTITNHTESNINGGRNNVLRVTGPYNNYHTSSILGGSNNTLLNGYSSTIVGGWYNTLDANGWLSNIGGGAYNNIYGNGNVIGGGIRNYINNGYTSEIVGGYANKIEGDNWINSIVGGWENYILSYNGFGNFIGNGAQNRIIGPTGTSVNDVKYSSIVGGRYNNVTRTGYSFIGGGRGNQISGSTPINSLSKSSFSSIVGGYNNSILLSGSAQYQANTIGGGINNTIRNGYASEILGGYGNYIRGQQWINSIVGGYANRIDTPNGSANFIGNGGQNQITGNTYANSIVGGDSNILTDSVYSSIVGGRDHIVDGSNRGFIGGGQSNIMTGATSSIITGGKDNKVYSNYSSVIGGQNNTTDNNWSSIIGGKGNIQSGGNNFSTLIGAGYLNNISGQLSFGDNYNTIINGRNNHISTTGLTSFSFNTIVGGRQNSSLGVWGFVGGGAANYLGVNGYRFSIAIRLPDPTRNEYGSFIGGGISNRVYGSFNSVVGGTSNYISSRDINTSIVGGRLNSTYTYDAYGTLDYNRWGTGQFIGGGHDNNIYGRTGFFPQFDATSRESTIVGGRDNYIDSSNRTFIGGGFRNGVFTKSRYSVLVGGIDNKIETGQQSLIVGGARNYVNDSYYCAIVGGRDNEINSPGFATNDQFIGGGRENKILGNTFGYLSSYSSIIGGQNNTITASTHSIIGGGEANNVFNGATHTFLGGGKENYSYSLYTTIGGGAGNIVDDAGWSSIVGGFGNYMTSNVPGTNWVSFIGGGGGNSLNSVSYSNIVGGQNNEITSIGPSIRAFNSIGGGRSNTINDANDSSIVGGQGNTISTGTTHSFIGGGERNIIDNSSYSFIGSGRFNYIRDNAGSAAYGFIGGGQNNEITSNSYFGTVVGGTGNKIVGSYYSFIGGGVSNTVYSQYGNIVGGRNNTVPTGLTDTFIIGSNITAISANTTHVERFNVGTVDTGSTSTEVLVRETNGMVNTTPFSTVTGGLNGKYVELITGYTANVTQTITHNLGTGDEVVVDVIDTTNNERIGSVIDNYQTNALDLTLSQNYASIKIVIIG